MLLSVLQGGGQPPTPRNFSAPMSTVLRLTKPTSDHKKKNSYEEQVETKGKRQERSCKVFPDSLRVRIVPSLGTPGREDQLHQLSEGRHPSATQELFQSPACSTH